MTHRLRMASLLLEDVCRDLRDGALAQRSERIRQIADAIVAIYEVQRSIFQVRPDLDYFKNPPSSESLDVPSSADAAGHERVASTLARAYALVLDSRPEDAAALVSQHLEHEPSTFHKQWLRYELGILKNENGT